MRSIAFIGLMILSAALVSACGICGSNREAAERTRRLSNDQWAGVFLEAKALAGRQPADSRIHLKEDGIPPRFQPLQPQSFHVSLNQVSIHISGCVDDKVYVVIRGFDDERGGTIELLPGEGEPQEVLWRGQ